jgi:hypothetical protein
MKHALNEIDKIKARIQAEIDAMPMKKIIILPGESMCPRCQNPKAHITREVPSIVPGVPPLPVCTACALEAQRLGLPVREIV